jgi:hypothetical protein
MARAAPLALVAHSQSVAIQATLAVATEIALCFACPSIALKQGISLAST